MLELSENPHPGFVVTSAPGDPDPRRGDRRVAGRSPLEQAPF